MLDCVHHWLLPTPEGPKADARCKLCSAQREFENYIDEIADFRTTNSHRHIPKAQRVKCEMCKKLTTKNNARKHRETCRRKVG